MHLYSDFKWTVDQPMHMPARRPTRTTVGNWRSRVAVIVVLLFAGSLMPCAGADGELTLVTRQGDRMDGIWVEGPNLESVYWKMRDFAGPFQMPPDALTAVYGAKEEEATEKVRSEEGEKLCVCELASGNQLVGMPLALDASTLTFAIEGIDEKDAVKVLAIPRKFIAKLSAPSSTRQVLVALPGVGDKVSKERSGKWSLKAGKLSAESDDARCLVTMPVLPKRCVLDVELSWKDNSDFSVALATKKPTIQELTRPKAQQVRRVVMHNGQQSKDRLECSGLILDSWDERLVLMARTSDSMNLHLIADDLGGKKAGAVRLQIYIDVLARRAGVFRDGTYHGSVELPKKMDDNWQRLSEVVRFESFRGGLTIHSFRVLTWSGHTPGECDGMAQPSIQLTDGSSVAATTVVWDAAASQLIIEEESAEEESATGRIRRLGWNDWLEIQFPCERPALHASLGDSPKPGRIKLRTRIGSEITGRFSGVAEGRLAVIDEDLDAVLRFPVEDVFSVTFGQPESGADDTQVDLEPAVGVLRLGSSSTMTGKLVKSRPSDGATCLWWQPALSSNAQPLLAHASGEISYPKPLKANASNKSAKKKASRPDGVMQVPPPKKRVKAAKAKAARRPGEGGENKAYGALSPGGEGEEELMTLELRSGDSIPFRPDRIDEDGITFSSPLSEVTFVAHDQVRAISLQSRCSPAELTAAKKTRLLTVPRRYRERPPTHMLLSINKDILRCRLLSMDEKHVNVEIRLDTHRIPRDRIAAIVWLDPVQAPEEAAADAQVDTDPETERTPSDQSQKNVLTGDAGNTALMGWENTIVQDAVGKGEQPAGNLPNLEETADVKETSDGEATTDDDATELFSLLALEWGGQRMTIIPERCESDVLYGKNPVLRGCQLDLTNVSRLTFGQEIQVVVADLPVSQIVLTSAAIPNYLEESTGEGADAAGAQSPLVGKPAPPVELDRLHGKPFDLKDERGKIIVLDFWATWCGPCVQWMPKAEEIVSEFADQNVELVAVNLGETGEEIDPLLKRLDLSPTVVLDIDGVVAPAYQANAIPQTVVVDREGVVQSVLVGGGRANEEALRKALQSLIDSDDGADGPPADGE